MIVSHRIMVPMAVGAEFDFHGGRLRVEKYCSLTHQGGHMVCSYLKELSQGQMEDELQKLTSAWGADVQAKVLPGDTRFIFRWKS